MNTDANESLLRYSDWAFRSGFAVLAFAFVLLIIEYAASRAKSPAVQRNSVLVTAGGSGDAAGPATPGRSTRPERTLGERFGNMGRSVLFVATAALLVSIVLRGFATHRFPLGNMYEFVAMACAAALVSGLAVLNRPAYRSLWVFLLVPVLILEFLAGTVLYVSGGPVVPALKSFWLPIHVTIVSIGSGILMVAGAASVAYLLRMAVGDRDTRLGRTLARLPDAQTLDRIAYRTTIVAFPLFGAGIVLGAIWAEAAWGRFWGWDPKETVSFITWVVYAAYLHARATSGWQSTRAAWINVAGFVAMVTNLFIINFMVSGLHSYAGLN